MGFRKGLIKLLGGYTQNYAPIDDEARELSAESRRQKAQLRRIEMNIEIEKAQQELDALRGDMDSPDGVFTSILTKALLSQENPAATLSQAQTGAAPSVATSTHLSTEGGGTILSRKQIRTFIKGLPKAQKSLIKYATDDQIKDAIREKIPLISEESLNLCIEEARQLIE